MYENKDDSPLYIFDSSFDEDGVGQRMLNAFEVPFYFRDDLFSLVGEARRPPYSSVNELHAHSPRSAGGRGREFASSGHESSLADILSSFDAVSALFSF